MRSSQPSMVNSQHEPQPPPRLLLPGAKSGRVVEGRKIVG
jgi:hypothetical protein